MKKKLIYTFLALIIIHSNYSIVLGQDEEKSGFERLVNKIKSPELNIGLLIQFVADYQDDRNLSGYNGFSLGSARLLLYGKIDNGFGYLFQTNFAKSPAILDAMVSYSFSDLLSFKTGLFKVPFSNEFLIYGGDIDFVNRSQVVGLLAPGRQIGIQASSGIFNQRLIGSIGIFNGNNPRLNSNDNNKYLIAGRLDLSEKSFLTTGGILKAALNAAYSEDKEINFSKLVLLPVFEGKRYLYGADFRLELLNFLLSGEYIIAHFDPGQAAELIKNSIQMDGYYVTLGYKVLNNFQLLIRLDTFYINKMDYENELLLFGLNYWPNKISELQLNILIDQNEASFKRHQYLFNIQISF